ncbi:MAG: translation initiation factor IF-2 [Candidatus ainarchaeum sp.]|nr:translation initiation factor IF-2 [Candidatus ainarchaeum sp.]
MEHSKIRQPIVTICGHVDHGKTSLLDKLRESSIQKNEAGGITQKISFTSFPILQLEKVCPLIKNSGINLNIPGFLFIDTPGHAAFTNLRKRGGNLADLAILVIDINEGIKPQTAEVIQILKHNKSPFIIALNKIDNISGWQKYNKDIKSNIENQPANTKLSFDEKALTLVGALSNHGLDSDLFYNIEDFTKKIALVPCSAKTGEGLQELIMVMCGLSQKYLVNRLTINEDAKGVVLEIKKEKSISYIESILYDGELSKEDEIAVSNLDGEPGIYKIRILEEIQPLSNKFVPKEKVRASTGLRMQLIEQKKNSNDKTGIIPGMPFMIYRKDIEKIKAQFREQIFENIKTDKTGIIAKADSLGSLEALLIMLKQENIPVVKAGIGNINKTDIISAKVNKNLNELNAIIVGFNVDIDEEAKEISKEVFILTEEVVYKLIEKVVKFRQEKAREIEKARLMKLASLCKLRILPQYIFRNTKPAIFGVAIEAGKLISNVKLIDINDEEIGKIKNIQSENHSVEEATEGMEVAVSIPGVNFERQLKDIEFLYSELGESQFRNFKKNKDLLSQKEILLLQEIAEIKRKKKADWGI